MTKKNMRQELRDLHDQLKKLETYVGSLEERMERNDKAMFRRLEIVYDKLGSEELTEDDIKDCRELIESAQNKLSLFSGEVKEIMEDLKEEEDDG